MQYRNLGSSGITVSAVCLGTMTFGEQTPEDEAHRILDAAAAGGVTLLDAAENYPVPPRPATQGRTEEIVGSWLKARGNRAKVVVATKVIGRGEREPHIRGGVSRPDARNIAAALDGSLKRLKTDYIDLYQLHFPDRLTNTFEKLGYAHDPNDASVPIAETVGVFGELIKAGKIRAFGVSNETPWGLMQYLRLAERDKSLPRVAALQNPYSLVNRAFEVGLAEMCIRENVPLLGYSPLGFGALTGKYLDGARPADARLTKYQGGWVRYLWPRAEAAHRAYAELARRHGLSPAGMALAYAATRPFMGSVIIGARTAEQARENLELIGKTALSAEVLQAIDAIHALNPNPVLK
jgi:aryl-alcohol dehydrogenase-like predicted oxidoreductase